MKKLEIERKYLMKKTPEFDYRPFSRIQIEQFYKGENRYRWSLSSEDGKDVYELIQKVNISPGVNEENILYCNAEKYEKEYEAGFDAKINKKRIVYKEGDLKFEIDRFIGLDLCVMEIELPSLDHVFTIPDFLQKYIIKEVTGMPEFNNRNLAL